MANPKKAVEGATNLFDMLFLHNTDADKLKRIQQMGGMPMPSIAATKKDIPFEDYGDITLIGRKEMFDPSNKSNPFWNSDAYTVRAPQPFRLAQKGAGKRFDDDYAKYKDYGYLDSARYGIWDLEKKAGANPSDYSNVENFFESNGSAIAKFLDDSGIGIPEGSDVYKMREIRDANRDQFDKWMGKEIDNYFGNEQFFMSKPSVPTDTGRTRAVIKPYTADEVTKYMMKSKGAAQESSFGMTGTGANRAATADRLKSFDQMRSSKDMLKAREEAAQSHETLSMMQGDLMDALNPYYKYSNEYPWRYQDEAGNMLIDSNKMGLDRALNEYGFENVPDSLKKEIRDWQGELRTAPTQYFEGKPERPVSLGEFAGAIVPENASPETIGLLQKFGIDVQKYGDDAQRTALRDKFSKEMFMNPATLIGSFGAGALATGSDKAMANPVDDLRTSEAQWDMTPEERAIADLRASEASFGNQNPDVADAYTGASTLWDNVGKSLKNVGVPAGLVDIMQPTYESSAAKAAGDNSAMTGLFAMLEKLDPVAYAGLLGSEYLKRNR